MSIFFLAIALFSIGINEHTGVTGKDEYYLTLRTPLCMREQQVWLIPCLDGEPRLRKPPMLYWLTRASFEIFSPSLTSARLVAVGFAAILVLTIMLLSLELGDSWPKAKVAGLIGMSYLGLAVGSRILEHDVPVATFSAMALLWLLRWYKRSHFGYAILASLCLAAGFLTKGPIVLVVCGAGIISVLITDAASFTWLQRNWRGSLGMILFTIILTAPWFIYVYLQYPDLSTAILANELQDRRFPYFSLTPIFGLLLLSMPWGFIAGQIIWQHLKTTDKNLQMRIIWLGLTLLPFFFIRSFERYLFGSLVPLTLLLNTLTITNSSTMRIPARFSLAIILPIAILIQVLAIAIMGLTFTLGLNLLATAWFIYHWYKAYHLEAMALSAAILWACVIGFAYPRLGINYIPPSLLEQVKNQEIVLFNGPQPALLPAVLGRSLVHVNEQWHLPSRLRQPCAEFWLLTEDFATDKALIGLKQQHFTATERGRFGIFSSRVTWANMLRKGTSWALIWKSLQSNQLSAIMPQVVLYRVRNNKCWSL